ncbi:hypothetical protein ACOSQ4_021355 [Xanthoceras sorbifolium]
MEFVELQQDSSVNMTETAILKGNDEPQILLLITSGFTGELAGWWDDHLTKEQKVAIRSASTFDYTSMDQMGNPIVKLDMINMLMSTICLHFVGNLDVYHDCMSEQLINLKCPSLSHFRCRQPTIAELRAEMNSYKEELKELKKQQQDHEKRMQAYELYHLEAFGKHDSMNQEEDSPAINSIDKVIVHKWYSKVTIVISKAFIFEGEVLIDSGADLNYISEGIIPSQYFSKTTQVLNTANGGRMMIEYKLSEAAVCNDRVCFETPFILVKGLSESVILGTPFLSIIYPFMVTAEGIESNIDGKQIKFPFAQQPKI